MNGIFSKDSEDVLKQIAPGKLSMEQRLAVYRNNVYVNLTNTLLNTYPVVQRLVGEEFFKYAAKYYIESFPSTSGDLNQYGGQFADFLSCFPATLNLGYMPDVARMEWACHLVYSAADHSPLAVDQLSLVSPDNYGGLTFTLHPAVRLLKSEYPIYTIWQVNQLNYEGDQSVDLSIAGECLLVQCRNLTISVENITEAEWTLLSNIADGAPLGEIIECLLRKFPNTDVGMLLQRYIIQSVITGYSV